MTQLISPKVRILLEQEGTDELLEYVVQTDNRDAVRWDLLRAKKQWPKGVDAPMLWMTVLAWNALRRSGITVPDNIEPFLDKCVQVSAADKDGNPVAPDHIAEDTVDPFPLGAEPGSS